MNSHERLVRDLLGQAGIAVDGPAPHDLHVHDRRFYTRVIASPSLGLGESYMDGCWSCAQLAGFFCPLLRARLAEYGRRRCAGLPVTIEAADYRQISRARHGRFDKVVSIGMFEHVGPKNYRTFMRIVDDVLADDGLFLLHTIGDNVSRMRCDA